MNWRELLFAIAYMGVTAYTLMIVAETAQSPTVELFSGFIFTIIGVSFVLFCSMATAVASFSKGKNSQQTTNKFFGIFSVVAWLIFIALYYGEVRLSIVPLIPFLFLLVLSAFIIVVFDKPI